MSKIQIAHQNEFEHLCAAIQPDGRNQRCIRFQDHEGPHQTFVAEWGDGDAVSRRRQVRQARCVNPGGKAETRVPAFARRAVHAPAFMRGY